MHKTFTFDCASDGSLYGEDFICETMEQAEQAAVAAINANWGEGFATYRQMKMHMAGCAIIEHPAIMAPRLPQDTVTRYRSLAALMREMIEDERISDLTLLPDDLDRISVLLDELEEADPGDGERPPVSPIAELKLAASALADSMEEALDAHIYQDGEAIPADCGYVVAIQRVRAALGQPPEPIETVQVWRYSATFAQPDGDLGSYSTTVTALDASEALARGRADLDISHSGASKVDAFVSLIAGEAA